MTTKLLKVLLFLLVNTISIAYSKAQDSDSVTCLKNKRLDYLLLEQRDARFLRADTAFKAETIRDKDKIISKQTDDNSQFEKIIEANKNSVVECKKINAELNKKITKKEKSLSFFRPGFFSLAALVFIEVLRIVFVK